MQVINRKGTVHWVTEKHYKENMERDGLRPWNPETQEVIVADKPDTAEPEVKAITNVPVTESAAPQTAKEESVPPAAEDVFEPAKVRGRPGRKPKAK